MIAYNPYHKKKPFNRIILVVLLVFFLSFAAVNNLFGVRSLFQAVIYPFQYATVSVWRGLVGFPSFVGNLRSLSQENERLRKELSRLKPKLTILNEQINVNQRLQQVLGFKRERRFPFKLLTAQVIGRSPSPWYSRLEINKGTLAGVKKDMVIVAEAGLVGRVIEVSVFSSIVMMLTDVESSVAAVDARSRDFGVVEGGAPEKIMMKYVSAGGDITQKDKVVSSQISTIFPAGITIGTIQKASKREHDLFYHIEIKPAVDFSKLEEVFIII